MDCKRQFEKDKDAEKYLKWLVKYHSLSRRNGLKKEDKLRVEIINTNANQLNLQLK